MSSEHNLSSMHVLLVDDSAMNIKMIQGMFMDYAITTDTAENGKIAVQKVRTTHYDLILMDLEMPEMNGYEATSMIRNELKYNVPIFAMSAHTSLEEREKSQSLGMNDYLLKPLSEEILLKKMNLIRTGTQTALSPGTGTSRLVDLAALKRAMNNNTALIKEIIVLFIREVPEDLNVISEAIRNLDYQTVKRRAHRMRSTLLTVGIDPMAIILKEMETLSQETKNMEKIRSLVERLQILSIKVLDEMEEERKKI